MRREDKEDEVAQATALSAATGGEPDAARGPPGTQQQPAQGRQGEPQGRHLHQMLGCAVLVEIGCLGQRGPLAADREPVDAVTRALQRTDLAADEAVGRTWVGIDQIAKAHVLKTGGSNASCIGARRSRA